MANEWTIQVPEDVLNEISNNLSTVKAVTQFAEFQATEINTTNSYINIRIRAFEGIFNLLTVYLQQLDNQIQELLKNDKEI